ncbi:NIFU1 [Scenedesmus sp. PABB004]|nr:NIFU1 [Scenedesmus sp. PABB004]
MASLHLRQPPGIVRAPGSRPRSALPRRCPLQARAAEADASPAAAAAAAPPLPASAPAPVTDAAVPEGHKGLHGLLYGEGDAAAAHSAARYEFRKGEDDGSALLRVDDYLASRIGEKPLGVYAVLDAARALQYVGYSRNMVLAIKGHLARLGGERVAWVRPMVFANRAMATRAAMEAQVAAWLAEAGAPPPGNGAEAELWGGAASEEGLDVSLLSDAEREAYEEKKLKLRKAMGESLHDDEDADVDAERRRLALLAAVSGDNWSAVVSGQTQETLDEAVEAGGGRLGGRQLGAQEMELAVAAAAAGPGGGPVVSPFAQPGVHRKVGEAAAHDEGGGGPPAMTVEAVDAALEEVRPYLLADGGDVSVVGVEDGIVAVALQGACSSCASSSATLKMGIERQLRAVFGAQVVDVVQVDSGARPAADVDGVNLHLGMLRSAVAGLGGAVECASVGGGVAVLQYRGPDAIGKGVTAAVRDAFPDIKEVVLRPFPDDAAVCRTIPAPQAACAPAAGGRRRRALLPRGGRRCCRSGAVMAAAADPQGPEGAEGLRVLSGRALAKRALGAAVLAAAATLGPWLAWRAALAAWAVKWTLLAAACAVEWAFYTLYWRPTFAAFNGQPPRCEPAGYTAAEARATWARFLHVAAHVPGGIDPRSYLVTWFCGAPFADIRRDNVAEMLTYGFYYRRIDEMVGELAGEPGRMVNALQEALGVAFAPGYTPGLRFMAHLWEPLRASWRPLALYAGLEAAAAGQRLLLAGLGFRQKRLGLHTYYTLRFGLDWPTQDAPRAAGAAGADGAACVGGGDGGDDDWTPFAAPPPPPQLGGGGANPLRGALPGGAGDAGVPVLFLHGVGGLVLYLEMLRHVVGLGHPVIVVEMKHVSMRVTSYIPPVDEVAEGVVRVLEAEGLPRVCVVAHSYGSFVASVLNRRFAQRVHSVVLVDPVCLGMFMPSLLNNFLYRRPRIDWRHPDVCLRDLALRFASRDVHIAATFARRFYWTDLNCWPDELPPGLSTVILSGNDDLCPAEEVERMLGLAGNTKVIINPHLFHGAFLLDAQSKAGLMAEVRNLLDSSGSLVARLAGPVVDRTLSAARSLLHDVGSLTQRLSLVPSVGRGQAEQLRRTVTDLPGRTWSRLSGLSDGRGLPAALTGGSWSSLGRRSFTAARSGSGSTCAPPSPRTAACRPPCSPLSRGGAAGPAPGGAGQAERDGLTTIPSSKSSDSGKRSSDDSAGGLEQQPDAARAAAPACNGGDAAPPRDQQWPGEPGGAAAAEAGGEARRATSTGARAEAAERVLAAVRREAEELQRVLAAAQGRAPPPARS